MVCDDVSELRAMVTAWAANVDVAMLSPAQAAAAVRDVTVIANVTASLQCLLAARAADGDGWERTGDGSAAGWLARETGITAAAARERIATGQRLRKLDATNTAALAGALSVEQSVCIADAAAANPAAERHLLDRAQKDSLGELRQACLAAKHQADPTPAKTYERLHAERKVWTRTDRDGAFCLGLRTTPDAGAEILSELNRLTDGHFEQARRSGRREPHDAYAADALLTMARRSRDGEPGGKVPVRYLAIIRADLAALVRGHVDDGEVCEIAGLGPIPVERARDLLGESILKLICTNGRDANVTHLGRGANAAQRVALLWRSPLCEVEGCARRAHLENDHVQDYARTRHTTLNELGPRCWHHHRLKTRYGWEIVDGDGKRPMVPPDHPRHPRNKPPPETGAA
jgi:hypothetical protein